MRRVESKLTLAMAIGAGIGAGLGGLLFDILALGPGALGAGIGAALGVLVGRRFSHSFSVFGKGETPVARANLSKWFWRKTAKLEVGGTHYEAYGKGGAGKELVLETEDGRVVAVTEKPSVWRYRYVLEHAGNRYELKKESVWGSAFVLSRESVGPVGSVRSKGFFKREWTANLPEELPLEVWVFIVWLTLATP